MKKTKDKKSTEKKNKAQSSRMEFTSSEVLKDKKIAKLLGLESKQKGSFKDKLLGLMPKKLSSLFTGRQSAKLSKLRGGLLRAIGGRFLDTNEKQVLKLRNFAKEIEKLEKEVSKMSQQDMLDRVAELKKEFQGRLSPDTKLFLEKNKAWLETKQGSQILDFIINKIPICYALVREAAHRTSNHKHFEVQLMAGIALAQGRIIEFKTGEGKTLVAPLALFLYSLFGRGAYLVTVNDYLARRDGEWVGHMLDYLGISVGVINQDKSYRYVRPELLSEYGKSPEEVKLAKQIDWSNYSALKGLTLVQTTKKSAYSCDITYGTNSEFGFDYLRDNMQRTFEDMNQRDPFFCVIDEVDSILIDEARTPLIIADSAEESNMLYQKFAKLVKNLKKEDYQVDEKEMAVTLTESGIRKMEKWLGVDNLWLNPEYAKHLDRALLAEYYYKKDDHYVVQGGEIVLVDRFTGRLQPGRHLSDGIHQAIQAKEGVAIQSESRTVATVTYQNYFRLFPVLSGMTGTALTEAEEFGKIYNLDVVEIPTNKPMIREDLDDLIYKDEDSKFRAIVNEIAERHAKGQPVLVGTVSVDKSEKLSSMLKRAGIKHEVLNAKNHAREAEIVAKAGQKGSVTISTNMAGRGTDVRLGEGVKELGGLYVIGTERHESRRIDNQLRGRAGRQGDPGVSRFYLALDDQLMRIYGGDLIKRILAASNVPDDMAFGSKFITGTIKSAQRRVEAENFDIRKNLVEFDDVLNKQRLVVYNRRRRIIELFDQAKKYYLEHKSEIDKKVKDGAVPEGEFRLRDYVISKLKSSVDSVVDQSSSSDTFTSKDIEKLLQEISSIVPRYILEEVVRKEFSTTLEEFTDFLLTNPAKERVKEQLRILVDESYDMKEKDEGFLTMREIEKYVLLEAIDYHWVEHLENMEDLRSDVSFQGYARSDPLSLYQNLGYNAFVDMMNAVDRYVARTIMFNTSKFERLAARVESHATSKLSEVAKAALPRYPVRSKSQKTKR